MANETKQTCDGKGEWWEWGPGIIPGTGSSAIQRFKVCCPGCPACQPQPNETGEETTQ